MPDTTVAQSYMVSLYIASHFSFPILHHLSKHHTLLYTLRYERAAAAAAAAKLE
jgi:hypothetical protein